MGTQPTTTSGVERESIITLPEIVSETVSKRVFEKEFGTLKKELAGVNKILFAVIVVMVIGFITMLLMVAQMLLDTWRIKTQSNDALIKVLYEQQGLIQQSKENISEQNSVLQSLDERLKALQATLKK